MVFNTQVRAGVSVGTGVGVGFGVGSGVGSGVGVGVGVGAGVGATEWDGFGDGRGLIKRLKGVSLWGLLSVLHFCKQICLLGLKFRF